MTTTELVYELLSHAPSGTAARKQSPVALWQLDDPGFFTSQRAARASAVDKLRRDIMRILIADSHNAYIFRAFDPIQDGVPGTWKRAEGAHWHLPSDLNFDDPDTERWLFAEGNWALYRAPSAVDLPDPFQAPPRELVAWIRENLVEVVVAANPDATEWIVAIAVNDGA